MLALPPKPSDRMHLIMQPPSPRMQQKNHVVTDPMLLCSGRPNLSLFLLFHHLYNIPLYYALVRFHGSRFSLLCYSRRRLRTTADNHESNSKEKLPQEKMSPNTAFVLEYVDS